MRTSNDICLLCQKNPADQKNSHIIPKFFNKGLFDGSKHPHAYLIKEKYKRKVQDTIKEDHLFCSECEDKFNTLETYISLRLRKVGDNRYLNDFRILKIENFKYYESLTIRSEIFQLFWYSVVWRGSISNSLSSFKLDVDDENELRKILIQNIQIKQSDFIDHLDSSTLHLKYPFVLIRPQKFLRPPQSLMAASNVSNCEYWVNLVDYLLIFYKSTASVDKFRAKIVNVNVESPKIGIFPKRDWINFNRPLLEKAGEIHRG